MMRLRFAIAFLCLLVTGACVRSDISSYTDPAFRQSSAVSSMVVFGFGMSLEERGVVESAAVARLEAAGLRGIRGIDIAPPTRQLDDAQLVRAILNTGADSVLVIEPTGKGTTSTYVPPTYHPGSVYGTATTTGNFTTLNLYQTPGYTSGGYSISKPHASYAAVLFEADTGAQLWQASIQSRGSAFDDYRSVAEGMAGDVIDELTGSGLASVSAGRPGTQEASGYSQGSTGMGAADSSDTTQKSGYAPGYGDAEPFAGTPDYDELKAIEGLASTNPQESRRRLLAVAERGNPLAMLGVGIGYAHGASSFPRDCALAHQWLERSAYSIANWNAASDAKTQLRAIVAMFRSDPEMSIQRICPAGATAAAAATKPEAPADWCHANQGNYPGTFYICIQAAEEDNAECQSAGLTGEQYSTCRWQLLMMREGSGTPPGEIVMGDCRLPSGSLITMNVKTCKNQGGTLVQ